MQPSGLIFSSLVVMGVAGCGKSSLGQALAAALGWPFVEGDDFHPPASVAKMRAGRALDDADRQGWLCDLGGQLAQRAPLVLSCSALRLRYRDGLRQARPGLGFVYLHISPALALQRVQARAARHLFPASLVESQFATLEPPVDEAGVICVDAALPERRQLQEVLGQLGDRPVAAPAA